MLKIYFFNNNNYKCFMIINSISKIDHQFMKLKFRNRNILMSDIRKP